MRFVVLEKTFESPLDSKEIQQVHPKGNRFWIFFGRTDAEAETPILWPPVEKNWLTGKDPDAGNAWRQEQRGRQRGVGWMAWPIQWALVWVNSGSWRWTGRPGVLQCMGLQRLSDWTELNRTSKLRYGPLLVNGIQGTNLCENYQETKTKRKQGASKMGQALKYIKKRIQNTWRRTDCLNT